MKKILLITALSLFKITIISSQEIESIPKKSFQFGLITGVGFYNYDYPPSFYGYISDRNSSMSESSSYYLGFFTEKKLSNKFSAQGEFLYLFGPDSDFIQIPIFLKYKLSDKISFYSGVQFNYMLEEKNDVFNRAGLGFNAGVEYNFAKKWFLDLRYVHNLPQIKKYGNNENQIRQLRLGVGYRF